MAVRAYFVHDKAQMNGVHEIHTEQCVYLPPYQSLTPLGSYSDCWEGFERAKRYYNQINGCKFCVPWCHTPINGQFDEPDATYPKGS